MPFVNSRGQSLHGVGGGVASIDNRAIHASFGGSTLVNSGAIGWLDTDTACIAGRLNPVPAGWQDPHGIGVFAYHVPSGQLAVLAERASVKGFANGGKWAAYLDAFGTYGSYGDIGQKFIAAIGPDGRAVYAPHAGQPYRWLDDDALLYDGLLEPGSLQLLGNRQALAATPGHRVIAFGLPNPVTVGKVSTPRKVGDWLLSVAVNQGRIVLHPWDSTDGYVVWNLVTQGPFFGYAAVQLGNSIRVVGARTEGEQPGDLLTVDVDLSAPRVSLVATDEPEPPESEPPDPEPDPMPEPTSLLPDVEAEYAKYTKPLKPEDYGAILNAVAWKHRADGWGLSVKPDGNRVPSPQGVDVAYDILHHHPTDTLWGCFGDNGPNWGLEDPHGRADRPWLAPIQPSGGDDGDPGDEDDGQTTDPADLVAVLALLHEADERIHHLEVDVGELRRSLAEQEQVMVDAAKAANDRLTKLEKELAIVKADGYVLPSFDPGRYYAEGRIGVSAVLRNDTVQWQIKERP